MNDTQNDKPVAGQTIDTTRRRLAKAGLAAPAVLGFLASRPVLANNPNHMCTPSGHISGFVSPSPNGAATCAALGNGPDFYKDDTGTWPGGVNGEFLNNSNRTRAFRSAPAGVGLLFADAYVVLAKANNAVVRDATVWDILKGFPVNGATGNPQNNNYLTTKPGFTDDATFSLGREAIAAAMNAVIDYPAGFPVSPKEVVMMFNHTIVTGGTSAVTATNTWNAAEVVEYFQTLHT